MEVTIWIGKQGLTETVVSEIQRQLNKKQTIKIKLLPAFAKGKSKKILAKEIAEKAGCTLMGQIGGVITLKKITKSI